MTYVMSNDATITIRQKELGCNQYLSSYKHFFVKKLPSKMCSIKLTLRYFLEGRCRPTPTSEDSETDLKHEGPDQTV